MKKLLYLTTILVLCMSFATPVVASPAIRVAQDGVPVPQQPGAETKIYLPSVMLMMPSYTVSGQVKDAQDMPMSGVTVKDVTGRTATTNANGQYSLVVAGGNQVLSPAKPGYKFDPLTAKMKVSQSLKDQNFTALAACDAPILNPSFETVPYYWNPISLNAYGHEPYYTNEKANTGVESSFTGIRPGQFNIANWSRWRTHEISIPITATSADVTLFLWPQTSETVVAKANLKAPDIIGFNTESPDMPQLAGDGQFVAVTDQIGNIKSLLVWVLQNDQAWVSFGPLSLLPWAGQTIKLEIGSYNDGIGGVTSAFVDDVNVSVCPGGAVAPGCSNLLLNSNFEAATDWVIKTATYPSAYTTEFASSPVQSMRSGISLSIPNPFPNIWTTSEFYQPVTIPADAYSARLTVRLLPKSAGWYGPDEPLIAADSNEYDPQALAATEAQYGYIMDSTGLNSRAYLFRWFHVNSSTWLVRQFNLLTFRGQAISVLFGAANDGYNGNTALYVDDATLDVCH
jgi:hypothetical protein